MFKPRKVGWSDYGSRGLPEGEGNCLKSLNESVTEKRGEEKKGGQAGSRGGCRRKKGGLETPYELWFNKIVEITF